MKKWLNNIRHRSIVKKMEIPGGCSVLDTSCQDGSFLSVLSNRLGNALRVSGVDVSGVDIEIAQKNNPKGIFKVADNTNLPFENSSFDVVVSSMTLHHMREPKKSILEMKRVLRQTGSIYLIDVISTNKLSNCILRNIRCSEPYHFEKFYSLEEVEHLLEEVGLHIESKERVVIFPSVSIILPLLIMKVRYVYEEGNKETFGVI